MALWGNLPSDSNRLAMYGADFVALLKKVESHLRLHNRCVAAGIDTEIVLDVLSLSNHHYLLALDDTAIPIDIK